MSNVIQLFKQEDIEDSSGQDTSVAIAVSGILASSAQLGHAVKELSKQFDALDRAIDTLRDMELRTQQKRLMKLSRESLAEATLELSRCIRKLPGIQIRATLEKIG